MFIGIFKTHDIISGSESFINKSTNIKKNTKSKSKPDKLMRSVKIVRARKNFIFFSTLSFSAAKLLAVFQCKHY
jgi:hypothetical protein